MYKEDTKDATKTIYSMFLYKNPGLKKYLRFKLHSWGVQTLEQIVKKELEMKARIKESKEKMMEKKEKLKEKKEKIKEKLSDLNIVLKPSKTGGNDQFEEPKV